MAPYSYRPLERKSEIRVLQLLPALEDYEPLCGSLVHVDLDSQPYYKTLSYTWGEPEFTCTIKLDGYDLAITQDLHSALRRLRSTDGVVVIWADAICINQKSIPERNHGVSLMQRVYGECDECMIYLGEERDNSSIVPEFLTELYNGFVGLDNEGVRPGDRILDSTHDSYTSIPKRDHPGWVAIRLFISRPWFRRVWVIQEFALPRLVTMVCGDWTMDATMPGVIIMISLGIIVISHFTVELNDPIVDELADRGLILVQAHLRLRFHCGNKTGPIAQHFDTASAIGTSTIASSDRSLYNLVVMTSMCDSSDPRDRFYGVFGLCTDLDDPGLEADYAKEVEEVELDVVKHIFKRGHGLQYLERSWCSSITTDSSASWLRGWNKQPVYHFSCGIRARNDIRHQSTASYLQPIRLEAASNIVLINGYFLDIVEELGMERSSDCLSQMTVEALLRQIEAMIGGSSFLRNGHYSPDAAWRTLIGNKLDKVSLESAEYSTTNVREIFYDPVDNVETSDYSIEQLKDIEELTISLAFTQDARFCITRSGLMAMVPRYARTGDAIITVFGDPYYQTFVVRKRANSDCHIWIGKAYIHCISGDEYRDIEEGEPCEIKIR